MKVVTDHIKKVKGKPHHVRKQVTLMYAGVLTAFIAVVWLGSSLASGTFALKDTSFADVTGAGVTASENGGATGLAGAVAAPALGNKNAPASIQIIDTASSTLEKPEPTTIPF